MEVNIKRECIEETDDSLDSLTDLKICDDASIKTESDAISSDVDIKDVNITELQIKLEPVDTTIKLVSNSDASKPYHELKLPVISSKKTTNESNKLPTTKVRLKNVRRKCTECSIVVERSKYKSHIVKNHPSALYYCNDCNYSNVLKTELVRHSKIHINIKSCFTCDKCSLTFKTHAKLKLHILEHNKKYNCTNCSFVTKDICDLEQHLRMHAVEEPYSCGLCAFKTPWKRDFELHGVLHQQQKSYDCDKCKFKTFEEEALKCHISIHFTIIQCTFCAYETISEGLFDVHMKRHNKLKPFKCTVCNSQFAWKHSFELHAELHQPASQNGLAIKWYNS